MDKQRVLLKLSGEVLKGKRDHGIDPAFTHALAVEIKKVHTQGVQIAIVVGGGNIFRGAKAEANGMDRTLADYTGMLATIMNGLALQDAFKKVGLTCHVLSAIDMPSVCENYTKRDGIAYLDKGDVIVCVGGTGNPFFSTDSAAALRALELECTLLLKGTKVDGIFDKDPELYSDAELFDHITYEEILQKNLRVMDQTAFALLKDNHMPMKLFNVSKLEHIERGFFDEGFGTKVTASS